jgi:hypothetical protein
LKFFGPRYLSAAYIDAERVDAPIGESCRHCDEPIVAGDDGWVLPPGKQPFHRACFLRGIIGSVAHQQGRCSCFVSGSTRGDDPALTLRQAAEAAADYHDHGSRDADDSLCVSCGKPRCNCSTCNVCGRPIDVCECPDGECAPESYTCRFCQRVSYNANDIAQRYCGHCHKFATNQ